MMVPVGDARVEDGLQHLVLAHTRIEGMHQDGNFLFGAPFLGIHCNSFQPLLRHKMYL
jgi:hypothetical protein